jgi:hypothetical protein
MLHLQARVYWSRLRRFVQADNVDGRRYSYVAGDPVNARDPSGHKAVYWDLQRDASWTYRPSGGGGGNCMDFGQCGMTVHWDLYTSVDLGPGQTGGHAGEETDYTITPILVVNPNVYTDSGYMVAEFGSLSFLVRSPSAEEIQAFRIGLQDGGVSNVGVSVERTIQSAYIADKLDAEATRFYFADGAPAKTIFGSLVLVNAAAAAAKTNGMTDEQKAALRNAVWVAEPTLTSRSRFWKPATGKERASRL